MNIIAEIATTWPDVGMRAALLLGIAAIVYAVTH